MPPSLVALAPSAPHRASSCATRDAPTRHLPAEEGRHQLLRQHHRREERLIRCRRRMHRALALRIASAPSLPGERPVRPRFAVAVNVGERLGVRQARTSCLLLRCRLVSSQQDVLPSHVPCAGCGGGPPPHSRFPCLKRCVTLMSRRAQAVSVVPFLGLDACVTPSLPSSVRAVRACARRVALRGSHCTLWRIAHVSCRACPSVPY